MEKVNEGTTEETQARAMSRTLAESLRNTILIAAQTPWGKEFWAGWLEGMVTQVIFPKPTLTERSRIMRDAAAEFARNMTSDANEEVVAQAIAILDEEAKGT